MSSQNECQVTQKQEASIYCIKHGHADYIWTFFGYVHCGRCGDQIGDTLAGVFDTKKMIVVGHKCKMCSSLKRKLNKLDKEILKRLEKNKETFYDYDKILDGLNLVK